MSQDTEKTQEIDMSSLLRADYYRVIFEESKKLAEDSYQEGLLSGSRRWDSTDLVGTERLHASKYMKSVDNLLEKINASLGGSTRFFLALVSLPSATDKSSSGLKLVAEETDLQSKRNTYLVSTGEKLQYDAVIGVHWNAHVSGNAQVSGTCPKSGENAQNARIMPGQAVLNPKALLG